MSLVAAMFGSIFIVGTAIGLFMESLSWVIHFFQGHWNYVICGLPPLTLAVAYFENFKDGKRFGNTALIIEEIKNPRRLIHWLLAPWIFALTLLFHFLGASVGRESTAVQIGASLSESWGRFLKIRNSDRPILLRIGLAAGFGAAFGLPLAGAVFAIETPLLFRWRDWFHIPYYLLASLGAQQWCNFVFGAGHSVWHRLPVAHFNGTWLTYFLIVLFLSVICLSYELLFLLTIKFLKNWSWWAVSGTGSFLLVVLTLAYSNPQFNNLGVDLILQSFENSSSIGDAISKLGFTFISILSGMKGGEVTPLMAAGALFGSWFGSLIPDLGFQVGASLGLVSLFSLRLHVPMAAFFMLLEIFDWKIALLGLPLLLIIEFGRRAIHASIGALF